MCVYKRTSIIRHFGQKVVAMKKQSIMYSENLSVALFIQHAKRMRRIVLFLVKCLAAKYYTTLCHK
jgi:hypothetical protein